jgi:hypothetical protein
MPVCHTLSVYTLLLAPLSAIAFAYAIRSIAVRTNCCQPRVASRSDILDEKRGIEVLISFIFAYFFKTAIVLVS